jgi:CIC family chloride channel protein
LGVVFNRGLLTAIRLYARLPNRFVVPAAAITGRVIGLVGWFSPIMLGSGHTLAESTLEGNCFWLPSRFFCNSFFC